MGLFRRRQVVALASEALPSDNGRVGADLELDILRRRLGLLEARGRFLRLVREFFHSRGFLEVDAPLLVPSAGMEPHLDPFEATGWATGRRALLPTSPEFYLKKLLAAGCGPCFSLAPSFRDEIPGRDHSPEFLMLEWYRPEESLEALAADCHGLLSTLAEAFLEEGLLRRKGVMSDLRLPPARLELGEAFQRWVGVDWRALGDLSAWREQASRHGAEASAWSENDCFSYLLLTRIEPELAQLGRPALLFGYPLFQGALARERRDEPGVIDRFELYAAGAELANAYQELTDGGEQRRRYAAYQEERRLLGKPPHPEDPLFFAAVDHLPECAGIALGADRLLALLLGKSVADVRHGVP